MVIGCLSEWVGGAGGGGYQLSSVRSIDFCNSIEKKPLCKGAPAQVRRLWGEIHDQRADSAPDAIKFEHER